MLYQYSINHSNVVQKFHWRPIIFLYKLVKYNSPTRNDINGGNNMKKKQIGIVVCMLLFATVLPVTVTANVNENSRNPLPMTTVDWWPNIRHDATHSGVSSSVAPTGMPRWNVAIPAEGNSVVVINSRIYLCGTDYKVHCLNVTDGSQIWVYNIGATLSSPSVYDNKVFVGSGNDVNNRKVYCLDAIGNGNGTTNLIWSTSTGYDMWYSSPTAANNKVYIGEAGLGNKIYCFNTSTGAQVWAYATGSSVYGSPAVANGYVYCGSNDNKVYCLNANTGVKLWSYTTGGTVRASSAVINGYVYVGSYDKNVYCFDALTGAKVWNYSTGAYVGSSPAVVNGNVYIGVSNGFVYCLNAANGAFVWKSKIGTQVYSSPSVAGNNIYIGSTNTSTDLFCLNASTGVVQWSFNTASGGLVAIPAIVDGNLYIDSGYLGGGLYCLGGINHPPATPAAPTGPSEGNVGVSYAFTAVTTDPDGQLVAYFFDWGDGTNSGWTAYVPSGTPKSVPKSWTAGGTYQIKVKAKDIANAESGWSTPSAITINAPPVTPAAPGGPTNGVVDKSYTFTATTTDPEGNNIAYKFDWGDGIQSDWTPFVPSGNETSLKYGWSNSGTYNIKVKAKDIHESESAWSPAHTITIVDVPTLTIDSIKGGVGVSAVINNTGTVNATTVQWNITFSGGFVFPKEKTGTITTLPAGGQETIKAMVVGIGKTTITVHAICAEGPEATRTASGFVFLFFVFGVK